MTMITAKMIAHSPEIVTLNQSIEAMLSALISANAEEFSQAKTHFDALHSNYTSKLCMNCDACFDYYFHYDILIKLNSGQINIHSARKSMQAWQYVKNSDRAEYSINHPRWERKFNRTSVGTDKKIVYLDQNVISNAAKDNELGKFLENIAGIHGLQFVYSPAHIEEAYKIPKPESKQEFLSFLTQLTGNFSLQPGEKNTIELFSELPEYPFSRVASSPEAAEAIEANKILKDRDRSIHFPEYNTETHKKEIANFENIFDSLTDAEFRKVIFHSPSGLLSKSSYKNLSSHSSILHAVYTLHAALDLLGYKLDKKERTLRSSAHDIEHLIYGTAVDYFVTADSGLAARARQIYSFMDKHVTVLSDKAFMETMRPNVI